MWTCDNNSSVNLCSWMEAGLRVGFVNLWRLVHIQRSEQDAQMCCSTAVQTDAVLGYKPLCFQACSLCDLIRQDNNT